jgi:hypothetical protein
VSASGSSIGTRLSSVTRERSLPLGLALLDRPTAEHDAFAAFIGGARHAAQLLGSPAAAHAHHGSSPLRATAVVTTAELAAARRVSADVDRRAAEIAAVISHAMASLREHASDSEDTDSEPGPTPLLLAAHGDTKKRRASEVKQLSATLLRDDAAATTPLDEARATVPAAAAAATRTSASAWF